MKQETRVLNDQEILKLFNLSPEKVESMKFEHKKGSLYVYITLEVEEYPCPICGTKTKRVKSYVNKKILHAAITYKPCYIIYHCRRYVCTNCKKTFNERNPFAYRNMKLSALTVSNVLEDLKSPTETFSTVATRYGVSSTTVAAIFDSHVSVSRRKLPKIISIDEVYAFHSERSDYVCVLVDFLSKQTIDLLPTRRKQDLQLYFTQIPLEERKNVEVLICDMWHTYRIIAQQMFPYADCVLDKFHVYQEFHRRMNKVRIDIMKQVQPVQEWKKSDDVAKRSLFYKREQQYYLLKKWNWLLNRKDTTRYTVEGKEYEIFDPNIPRKYNKKLNKYCNYNDLLTMILDIDPKLKEAYNLKFFLNNFYDTATIITARTDIETLISKMYDSSISEFNEFGNTLRQWKQEIIISFNLIEERIYKQDPKTGKTVAETKWRKANNAIAENRNKVIKQLKHNANGFHNWERFRTRALYVLNDDATYRIFATKL